MRLAIVGSRDYPDLNSVRMYVDTVYSLEPDTIIISGGATGVDIVAIDQALIHGMKTEVYIADWNIYGKSAGFIHNHTIIEKADKIMAFWDGKSHMTRHIIEHSRIRDKPIDVITYVKKEVQ